MKNTLLAGVCAAAMTLVAPVSSQAGDMSQGWYISMFGGLSVPETMKGKFLYSGTFPYSTKTKLKNGFIVGLAVGKSITENLRGELEFAFSKHKPKSRVETNSTGAIYAYAPTGGGLKSFTILGNLWYDFKNTSRFTPYVGGGVGIGIVKSNMTYAGFFGPHAFNDSDASFAFQLGTGVNIAVSPSISVGLGYRFKGIVDFDLEQTHIAYPFEAPTTGLDLFTHNFMANVTFKLGGR